jgi:V8-like Glu-specific endopeptidase
MNARWILLAGGVFMAACSGELAASGDDEPTPVKAPNGDFQEKIVGGHAESGYPAVGALLGPGGTLCSGTLIASRWVLTAAHCFEDGTTGWTFELGTNIDHPTKSIRVTRGYQHPQYDAQNIVNDIAVAQLAADATGVTPAPLATSLPGGSTLTFVGFGLTSGSGQDLGNKRSVQMPISEMDATTFTYSTRGKNTCGGDSGGPAFLVQNGVAAVAGVTSYGDAACRSYGVDTRVDAYRDWVLQKIGAAGAAPAPAPAPAPADGCGSLDYLGECSGTVARWCDAGHVRTHDCAADGQACGYVDDQYGYYCVARAPAPAPSPDPCAGLDYLGRCNGSVAEWCDNGRFQTRDCRAEGAACGYVDNQVGYYCHR